MNINGILTEPNNNVKPGDVYVYVKIILRV